MRRTAALILAIAAVVILATGCSDPAQQTAARMLARIPGCTSVSTKGNNSFLQFGTLADDEASTGSRTLPDYSTVGLMTWSGNPPDTQDQENFAYWAAGDTPPTCCLIGDSPVSWVVVIETDQDSSDWSAVQHALGGSFVTHPPASWDSSA